MHLAKTKTGNTSKFRGGFQVSKYEDVLGRLLNFRCSTNIVVSSMTVPCVAPWEEDSRMCAYERSRKQMKNAKGFPAFQLQVATLAAYGTHSGI